MRFFYTKTKYLVALLKLLNKFIYKLEKLHLFQILKLFYFHLINSKVFYLLNFFSKNIIQLKFNDFLLIKEKIQIHWYTAMTLCKKVTLCVK